MISSDDQELSTPGRLERLSGGWEWLKDIATTWMYIIPLGVILGVLLIFGAKPVFLAALVAGILVWNYWGSRMETDDAVLILTADLERKTIGLTSIGRRLWRTVTKVNNNPGEWVSESGHSVHVVKDWDEEAMTVTYPPAKVGDLEVTIDPQRYVDMVKTNKSLIEENQELKENLDVKALSKARKWTQRYALKMDGVLEGKE